MTQVQKQEKLTICEEISGVARLGLRVSEMINHPIAQTLRRVTIHRLDTDGDREWEEVMSVLAEVDGLEMLFSDDGSVMLGWGAVENSELAPGRLEPVEVEERAPF